MNTDIARLRILEEALAVIERVVPHPGDFAGASSIYLEWSPLLGRLLTDIEDAKMAVGRAQGNGVLGAFQQAKSHNPT